MYNQEVKDLQEPFNGCGSINKVGINPIIDIFGFILG